MACNRSYSYSPMDGDGSSSTTANTKERTDAVGLLNIDVMDKEPVERSPSAMAKQMCEEMHQDLFRLILLEADEVERMEILGHRSETLASQHEETKAMIIETQQKLKSMEEPSECSVRVKQEMLVEVEAKIRELEIDREEIWRSARRKAHTLDRLLQEKKHRMEVLRRDIHYLQIDMHGEDPFPGPYALRFVDGSTFQIAAAAVIMSNMMTMFLQMTKPELDMKILNGCFLAFYVVELTLNMAYKQGMFLFGDPHICWWNWMDTIIVASGLLDTLLSLSGSDSPWLSGLRVLRVVRLARILKIVKIFMVSDLSWAEGHHFQTFMMGVIGFNTLLMGFETEYHGCAIWPYLEHVLLVIYCFELAARMKLLGCQFFIGNQHDPEAGCSETVWNWLDLVIVFGGIVDMWVMPTLLSAQKAMGIEANHDAKLGNMLTMLRMARLARILRLAKLIKNIPPLYTLVIGIAKAMQGMVWVMVLTVVVLYICALLGVKLVGNGWVVPDMEQEKVDEVKKTFEDIPEAIFNLFKAMNADLGGVEPLLTYVPCSKYIMMAFMVVTNWAIFSILTAVVSDNMAKVTEQHDEEMEEVNEQERKVLREEKLKRLFQRLDSNHDEILSRDEFEAMIGDEAMSTELCHITGLESTDLCDLFDLIAKKHSDEQEETITVQEFVHLLNRECSAVTSRSIMKLEKRLHNIEKIMMMQAHGGSDHLPPVERKLRRSATTK